MTGTLGNFAEKWVKKKKLMEKSSDYDGALGRATLKKLMLLDRELVKEGHSGMSYAMSVLQLKVFLEDFIEANKNKGNYLFG